MQTTFKTYNINKQCLVCGREELPIAPLLYSDIRIILMSGADTHNIQDPDGTLLISGACYTCWKLAVCLESYFGKEYPQLLKEDLEDLKKFQKWIYSQEKLKNKAYEYMANGKSFPEKLVDVFFDYNTHKYTTPTINGNGLDKLERLAKHFREQQEIVNKFVAGEFDKEEVN